MKELEMKKHAVMTGLAIGWCGGVALGGTLHTQAMTDIDSVGPLGDPENTIVEFEVASGGTIGLVNWSGVLTPVDADTRGIQARVQVTAPDGTVASFPLGSGAGFAPGTEFSGQTDELAGAPATGNWQLEFYESFDDVPGPDAVWDNISIVLTDDPVVAPDVTFCELYNLEQWGKEGQMYGLAVATTSWNVGNADLEWFDSPDSEHPFIGMNLYRLENGRFEQVGQSWCKHGFFALSNTQCGGNCTFEPGHSGGNYLGMGCTDTYSSFLNSLQSGLGPRFEINPFTGEWDFQGSMFQEGGPPNDGIARRLQVHNDDIDPDLHPDAEFFIEGYYVHYQDSNVWNSASWKPVTPVPSGSNYNFAMSGSGTLPEIGFAIDAWIEASGAESTVLAQEVPVNELSSPDGRCLLAVTAEDNGDGTWHYEYALLNVDMDRQVDELIIDVAAGATLSDVGFYAVEHNDEPLNAPENKGGVPIDNQPWAIEIGPESITWSTDSNPLRWGAIYNFWFDADVPPAEAGVTLSMFKPGAPEVVTGVTVGPVTPSCGPDISGDGAINSADLNLLLAAFGQTVEPGQGGDITGDGAVDSADLNALLAVFGDNC